ncbi:MAG TPA: hypothetical protein VKN63_07860 [Afifellaceae bacterium]|nr:hypothetical protein [Afifellaceae bacterium]
MDTAVDRYISGMPAAILGVAVMCALLLLPGCAGSQTGAGAIKEAAAPPPAQSAERAAAVAEIRQRAANAQLADTEPDVYQSYAPPERSVHNYREIREIEAELKAIADASARTSGGAELAALRKRAAYLEKLRRERAATLDESPSTGSIKP